MGPLERFAARTREATGGEISQAVYLLLLAFNLEETLPAYCLFLESSGVSSWPKPRGWRVNSWRHPGPESFHK